MVHYAKRAGVRVVQAFTDAITLDEKKAAAILDAGLDVLECSIHGHDETYELLMRNGKRDQVRSNVIRFRRLRDDRGARTKLVVSAVDQPLFKCEKEAHRAFWSQHADEVIYRPYHSWGNRIGNVCASVPEQRHACSQLWTRCTVGPTGKVLACFNSWSEPLEETLGDLTQPGATLAAIWQSRTFRPHPPGSCQRQLLAGLLPRLQRLDRQRVGPEQLRTPSARQTPRPRNDMRETLSQSLLRNPPAEPSFTATPREVSIEITGRCNLRCRHCFNESSPAHPNELSLERLEVLLNEVQSWGVRSVRITGGEPTVHRGFREVVEACRRRGIGIGLNTNGIYGPEMLDYLKTAPIEIFFVSLEGLEANTDAIRGAGVFRHAVETCRHLKAAGQKVMISFHVGEGNLGDVPGLVALAAELGVDLKVSPLRPVGRALRELPASLIQPANFHAVIRELTRLRRVHPHIRIYTDFDVLDGPPSSDCARDPDRTSCKAGRSLLNVRSDGSINPCAFFDRLGEGFSAGNIHRESATDVWQRSTTFQAFRVHQKSDTCQGCGFYQRRCNGGCPAVSFAVTGHLDTLDPTCFAHLVQPEVFPGARDAGAAAAVRKLSHTTGKG